MAMLRKEAMARAAVSVRTYERSSSTVTSRTQWMPFSIAAQWAPTSWRILAGRAWRGRRLVTPNTTSTRGRFPFRGVPSDAVTVRSMWKTWPTCGKWT